MKGLICYYSGSGNTQLACRYLAGKVTAVEWTLCDILRDKMPDFSAYDVVGFSTFTDFWGVPQRMIQFLDSVPEQKGRPAFVLMTFGMFLAFALRDLGRLARRRGFKTIGGFALHTPENFPPMICGGMGNTQAPNPKELSSFQTFLKKLNNLLGSGQPFKLRKPGENILFSLFPSLRRTTARAQMGVKHVDQSLCTQCGTCEKGCPYRAITLNPYPSFNQNACYGCWACYNHCPKQAIYTDKYRNRGHYPRSVPQLADKLRITPVPH